MPNFIRIHFFTLTNSKNSHLFYVTLQSLFPNVKFLCRRTAVIEKLCVVLRDALRLTVEIKFHSDNSTLSFMKTVYKNCANYLMYSDYRFCETHFQIEFKKFPNSFYRQDDNIICNLTLYYLRNIKKPSHPFPERHEHSDTHNSLNKE